MFNCVQYCVQDVHCSVQLCSVLCSVLCTGCEAVFNCVQYCVPDVCCALLCSTVSHSCHLLHVTLGDELLQLGDLPHPVEDPPPCHIEDLGCRVLNQREPICYFKTSKISFFRKKIHKLPNYKFMKSSRTLNLHLSFKRQHKTAY